MPQLAATLTAFAGRAVLDRTGLAGTYDIELTFSPEITLFVVEGGPVQVAPQRDGMSLATAVSEQLGLRLQSARGTVEVVVIDSAARPTTDDP
jgi:uncharacterized protein (TIGR03435 family)